MSTATDKPLMKIGEAARQAGVTTRTLRYYEELGLIESIKDGAQRAYTGYHVTLVTHIQQLKQLGFSLEEIGRIMALKKVVFSPEGKVRKRHGPIPLTREEVEALQDKTRNLKTAIAEQQGLLERLEAFLERSIKR